MNKEKIIKELKLKKFGGRGWMKGETACPTCGRGDKFGILFTEDSGICHCFYGDYKTSLYNYLKAVDRLDLIDRDNYTVEVKTVLECLKTQKEEDIIKDCKLPLGFRRIKYDEYLFNRGFTEEQYDEFRVGVANLDPRTEGKLIFQIYNHGELVGWLARSRNSYKWHSDNLKKAKEGLEQLVLRYRNSDNDFSKMLGGLDEITENTHTVILVEGLMDKANIDKLLELKKYEEIKCCYTFGSDVSQDQVDLLMNKVGLTNIILMYDANTINNMKMSGSRLATYFIVDIAQINEPDVDPGNASLGFIIKILNNMKNFYYFYNTLS